MPRQIGPSTGWLYANGIFTLTEQENVIRDAGCNCIEMCLIGWCDERTAALQAGTLEQTEFDFRSLHLPEVGNSMPDLTVVLEIIGRYRITTALTHPQKVGLDYPMAIYEMMRLKQIPLAIENMDKDSGFSIDDLLWITDCCHLGFVLDVQHAYEHDPAMIYARELFEALKDRLTHFHVSGQTTDNIHSLLYKADNAGQILDFLGELVGRKIPLILEGEYSTTKELAREIDFITKELGRIENGYISYQSDSRLVQEISNDYAKVNDLLAVGEDWASNHYELYGGAYSNGFAKDAEDDVKDRLKTRAAKAGAKFISFDDNGSTTPARCLGTGEVKLRAIFYKK